MTSEPADTPYTIRHVQEMLGLGRSAVTGLIEAGVVTPARGRRNEFRFSFQDVVLLRTAAHLRAAQIPPRRLHRSLKLLKARLPAQMPLSGLRIRAVGNDVAVRAADARWEADGGQLLLDWELSAEPQGTVRFLDRSPAPAQTTAPVTSTDDAAGWFRRGEGLEAHDRSAAEQAYAQALALDPHHADACLNLGALWCEAGRCAEAVALYTEAITRLPGEPLLHFNLAIALEDLQREPEALAAYERCLVLAPDLADAHYNAARLHEKLGHAQAALRHYSSYRRLQND